METPFMMDSSGLDMASKTAQRLPLKTSGPFDEVLTGVADDAVTSVDDIFAMTTDELAATTLSQSDLSNLLTTETLIEEDMSDIKDVFDLNLEIEGIGGFEDFMDMSEILLGNQNEATVAVAVAEIPSTSTDVATVRGTKRKRSAERPTPATSAIPPDHSGYTVTSKRLRLTSTASIASMSDTESDIFTSELTREERHVQRRKKNNVASKRSRETRKQKYVNMEDEAVELERSNAALREKITLLEDMAKEMKATLIQRMVAK